MVATNGIPSTYAEAIATGDPRWRTAMDEEIASLHSFGTWALEPVPPGVKPIPVKWVFTIKRDANGQPQRLKARLVAKGFMQREGIDFNEVYAPVVKHTTLRTLLSVAAAQDLELRQLDVKTAFLNGVLEETIYIQQPHGYSNGNPQMACRLIKALYGLRQAPRTWHVKLKEELARLGYTASQADPSLFLCTINGTKIYLLVYVDDMLVAAPTKELVDKVGRLTLLLGPPSSGKSTFMKALSGRLKEAEFVKMEGALFFNGQPPDAFVLERSAAYVGQLDNHDPNLSVEETLDFAYLCTTGTKGAKFNLPCDIYKKKLEIMASGDVENGHRHGEPAVAERRISGDSQGTPSSSSVEGGHMTASGAAAPQVEVGMEGERAAANGAHTPSADKSGEEAPSSPFTNGARPNKLKSMLSVGKRSGKGIAAGPAVHMDDFEETLSQVWGTSVKVHVVMKLLGVDHCRDTLVGNEIFRGISGGERKRLSTAEQLMSPRSVVLLDEISTGLDSATLFTVIRWFSKWCHSSHSTMMISLLQPPPEVFQLFDDVLIFTEGKEVYHGPVSDALPFFASLGFDCPTRKDIPSFLLEVTTAKGQHQYANEALRTRHNLPSTGDMTKMSRTYRHNMLVPIDDMRRAFWERNEHGKAMARELGAAPVVKASHPAALVKTAEYPLGPLESILVAAKRQATLVLRDRVLLKGRLMQVIVISLISGGLFYNLPTSLTGARSFFGLCFLMVLFINFGGFPQLPLTVESKKVWFKHRSNGFLPAYAQGLAMSLAQVPLSIIEATVFSIIMYWMVGLYPSAARFFTFWLITLMNSLTSSALFRFIGCLAPNQIIANAAGGLTMVTLIISSGFAIVRTDIPNWMIWAYWISPFAWGLRAYAINELDSPQWQDQPYPDDPSQSLGTGALLSFAFFTEKYWIWADIGFQALAYSLLTLGAILSLWLQIPEQPRAMMPDEEAVAEARASAEAHRQSLAALRQVAEAAAPQADAKAMTEVGKASSRRTQALDVDIDIASSLEFTPITLVFRDIGYTVPNPAYSRKAARAEAALASRAPSLELAQKEGSNHNKQQPGGAAVEVVSTSKGSASGAPRPQSLAAKEKLQLLTGITGFAEPGVLIALMGGSGAGKTTLMDVLAGRKTVGEITGDIMVNGHPKEQRTWARVVGYCEQNDIHSALQTVKEALMFSARLRLPVSVPDEKVRAYVDEVMDIIDLMDIMYSLVGVPGSSGLSVEQRKRLTIAVELVANPSVVFMDEPTSGLDARAAAIVMQAVRNVARNGRTVMVTIHQPSIEIFEAFDRLLLIQRGGKTTFFGPLGEHSQGLIDFIMTVPGTPALMPGYNPATWMLEVTGGSMATMVEAVAVDWPGVYASSALFASNREHADLLVAEAQQAGEPALAITSEYAQPFRVQMGALLRKFRLAFWRNPPFNLTRYATTLITAFIYAAVYWKQGQLPAEASITNIQSVMGIMYSSTNFLGMTTLMSIMPVVGSERVVFYRERGAMMYNPFAHGISMALVELPYLLVQTLVFVPIVYWMVDFEHSVGKFFYYLIMFMETISFYSFFGQFLVYVTPNQGIAQVLGGSLNFLFNIFNGFIITYPAMPPGWRWLNRITPSTWIMYGLAVSQLNDPTTPITYNGQTTSVTVFMENQFGYFTHMQWWCCLIVLAYILFVRVTSILALRYWNFLRR